MQITIITCPGLLRLTGIAAGAASGLYTVGTDLTSGLFLVIRDKSYLKKFRLMSYKIV